MSERVALRPGVVFREIPGIDGNYVMVKDPTTLRYIKFEAWEGTLLGLLDGTRTGEAVAATFNRRHPERRIDEQYVVDFAEMLRSMGLLERSAREKFLMLADRVRARRKQFWYAEEGSLTQILVPMFDPDAAMNRLMPWIRWVWSSWFVAVSLAVIAVAFGFLGYHWDLYWRGLFELFDPVARGPAGLLFLFVLITVVSLWHEMGHAFTCKRFGGEVHDVGFMLFYFQPAFFCNVDDSYLFAKRSHRIFTALGGLYFETMLCAVAVAVWITTPAETWIHEVALSTVLLCGIIAVFVNANPLIKLDGYFVLMDLLDVPELREESFTYVGELFRRHVLRLPVPHRAVPQRRKRIYVVYGILAAIYTTTLWGGLFLLLIRYFERWFGPVGMLAAVALVAYALRKRLEAAARFVASVWREKTAGGSPRRVIFGGIALALLAAAFLVRTPTRIDASFVVEAGHRAVVRAPAAGLVASVAVTEGTVVSEGATLAVIDSPEIDLSRSEAAASLLASSREGRASRGAGDVAGFLASDAAARGTAGRLASLDARRERLVLRSPIPGRISTTELESLPGRWVREGDSVCAVEDLRTVNLAMSAVERDVQEIAPGTPVRILAASAPFETQTARVQSIAAAARDPEAGAGVTADVVRRSQRVRVVVAVDNPGERLRPGMSGRVQFLTRSRSVAGKALWRLRRWIGSIAW